MHSVNTVDAFLKYMHVYSMHAVTMYMYANGATDADLVYRQHTSLG